MRRAWLVLLAAACATRPPEQDEDAVERQVRIGGNKGVETRELRAASRRELRAFLERGRRAADAADAAYAMEMVLREAGYAHGRVRFELSKDGVVFHVVEGPRVHLGEVSFEGVASVPMDDLKKYFDFPGGGVLGAGRPVYRDSEVAGAARKVETHYLLAGFFRVRVERPRTTWSEDRTRADVTVAVTEGRPYAVVAVEFKGIEPMELELTGKPYHVRLPAEAAARVRRRLLDLGHQLAEVKAEARVDHDEGRVAVRFTVVAGPRTRLRHVVFSGNARTKERFLRRRIPIEEGAALLQELVEAGTDNLYRSRLFSAVRKRVRPVDGTDLADLEFGLEERKAKSLDFELGYGSYELARGAVRYQDRNLFGLGRRFSTELSSSLKGIGLKARLEDPWLLGPRDVVETGFGFLFREEPSFDRELFEFDLTLRHRFSGPYTLRAGYRFRLERALDVTGEIPAVEQDSFLATAGLFARLRRDTRDGPLAPTRGSLAQASASYIAPGLGADLHFLELSLAAARYRRLAGGLVLAYGFRFTGREVLDGSESLPIQERIFLGGESSVRSFGESELGPVNAATGDPDGGLTSLEAGIELRARLWRDLAGALFYDVGMVSANGFSLKGPPGHALGLGLRYLFPVGPLRLDVAWNPGRRFAAGQDWAIHLAFGFSF